MARSGWKVTAANRAGWREALLAVIADQARRSAVTDRFVALVDRSDPAGCWRWIGAVNKRWGYGTFTVCGAGRRAHIVSYLIFVGRIPDPLVLDHSCRNRACVNPAHLDPVTQAVNCRRGLIGRALGTTGERNKAKTHCPHGHEYSAANTVCRNGRRHCVACSREHSAEYEQRRPPRQRSR